MNDRARASRKRGGGRGRCPLAVWAAVAASVGAGPVSTGWAQDGPPNIVVILVDDLRWDEIGAEGHFARTPSIDLLALGGTSFTRAYHVTPLCSPNRASLLTGQYPSRHGIRDNVSRNLTSHGLRTFPQDLQRLGYETAFIGKWHMGNDPTPRPGFDEWVSLPGQGRILDPEIYEDGRLHTVDGYVTDILNDRAVTFVERGRDAPFLLYLSHKAVHPDAHQRDDGSVDLEQGMRFIGAPRHQGVYDATPVERAPSFLLEPELPAGKTAWATALRRRRSPEIRDLFLPILDIGTSDESIRRRAEMLLSVDDGIGRIMEALERSGRGANTVIVFTSDNGYFFGEHGASIERRLPYEESVRAPLIVWYPGVVPAGSEAHALTLSVDLAPSLIELAGGTPGEHVQGRSWVPLLRGQSDEWRDAGLLEYYSHEQPMPWMRDLSYKVVHTGRFKLVHWLAFDADELYDLDQDPYELTNLAGRTTHRTTMERMRTVMDRLVAEVFR